MTPCEICGETPTLLAQLGRLYSVNLCRTCVASLSNWLQQQPAWQKNLEMDQQWEILLAQSHCNTHAKWVVLAQDRLTTRRALFGVIERQMEKLAATRAHNAGEPPDVATLVRQASWQGENQGLRVAIAICQRVADAPVPDGDSCQYEIEKLLKARTSDDPAT